MRGRTWTAKNRKILEKLILEGYMVPWIAKSMGLSNATVYAEIKRTIGENEYKERRYIKYTAEKAMEKDIMKIKGDSNDVQ